MGNSVRLTKVTREPTLHSGRHMISVPPRILDELRVHKERIEKEIGFEMTYGQLIIYLANKEQERSK
jgi:hypothetical protein